MDRGVFGLGNPRVDERALQWVMKHLPAQAQADTMSSKSTSSHNRLPTEPLIVVYGSGLDALAAVGSLLRHSVHATSLALVMPETELPEIGHVTVSACPNLHPLLFRQPFH
jgi:hypothetical protein